VRAGPAAGEPGAGPDFAVRRLCPGRRLPLPRDGGMRSPGHVAQRPVGDGQRVFLPRLPRSADASQHAEMPAWRAGLRRDEAAAGGQRRGRRELRLADRYRQRARQRPLHQPESGHRHRAHELRGGDEHANRVQGEPGRREHPDRIGRGRLYLHRERRLLQHLYGERHRRLRLHDHKRLRPGEQRVADGHGDLPAAPVAGCQRHGLADLRLRRRADRDRQPARQRQRPRHRPLGDHKRQQRGAGQRRDHKGRHLRHAGRADDRTERRKLHLHTQRAARDLRPAHRHLHLRADRRLRPREQRVAHRHPELRPGGADRALGHGRRQLLLADRNRQPDRGSCHHQRRRHRPPNERQRRRRPADRVGLDGLGPHRRRADRLAQRRLTATPPTRASSPAA